MKRTLLCLLFIGLGMSTYAQNKFQRGYFVDNDGKKIGALILNEKWTTSPQSFKYKFFDTGKVTTLTLQEAKEFSIDQQFKYKRVEFTVDNASDSTRDLYKEKTPQYTKKTAFLKVMVEAEKLSLYEYTSSNQNRFYYQKGSGEVILFRYNKYRGSNGEASENNAFQNQLKTDLNSSCTKTDIEYIKIDLVNYVISYNNCGEKNKSLVDFSEFELHRNWVFKVKSGITFSSIRIFNRAGGNSGEVDGNNLRFGFEVEHFLKFKKKNWSLFVEPTFVYYSSSLLSLEYSSLDLPIGIRNYHRISRKSYVFIDAGLSLEMSRTSTISGNFLEPSSVAFYGVGYTYDKRFSIEVRNYNDRRLSTRDNNLLDADQTFNLAIILGYRF